MKYAALLIAAALPLAACNKGPQVNLKNASMNEASQAVRQSGMMSGGNMIEPGLWQAKTTVIEMNIPGMPPQYAESMKQRMAQSREKPSSHCVTEADVKKPQGDMFGEQDKSCHYAHFTMGAGKIDIQMVCSEEGHTQTTSMSGSYTPTTYSMDVSSNGTGGGGEGNMSMKMHVDASRVGECTGKEG